MPVSHRAQKGTFLVLSWAHWQISSTIQGNETAESKISTAARLYLYSEIGQWSLVYLPAILG